MKVSNVGVSTLRAARAKPDLPKLLYFFRKVVTVLVFLCVGTMLTEAQKPSGIGLTSGKIVVVNFVTLYDYTPQQGYFIPSRCCTLGPNGQVSRSTQYAWQSVVGVPQGYTLANYYATHGGGAVPQLGGIVTEGTNEWFGLRTQADEGYAKIPDQGNNHNGIPYANIVQGRKHSAIAYMDFLVKETLSRYSVPLSNVSAVIHLVYSPFRYEQARPALTDLAFAIGIDTILPGIPRGMIINPTAAYIKYDLAEIIRISLAIPQSVGARCYDNQSGSVFSEACQFGTIDGFPDGTHSYANLETSTGAPFMYDPLTILFRRWYKMDTVSQAVLVDKDGEYQLYGRASDISQSAQFGRNANATRTLVLQRKGQPDGFVISAQYLHAQHFDKDMPKEFAGGVVFYFNANNGINPAFSTPVLLVNGNSPVWRPGDTLKIYQKDGSQQVMVTVKSAGGQYAVLKVTGASPLPVCTPGTPVFTLLDSDVSVKSRSACSSATAEFDAKLLNEDTSVCASSEFVIKARLLKQDGTVVPNASEEKRLTLAARATWNGTISLKYPDRSKIQPGQYSVEVQVSRGTAVLETKFAHLTVEDTPVINCDGIVNAFNYGELAPGGFAAVFGWGLATSTCNTSGVGSVPGELCGVKMVFKNTISGQAVNAPIFFTTANQNAVSQVNIQVPFEVKEFELWTVTPWFEEAEGEAFTVSVKDTAPALNLACGNRCVLVPYFDPRLGVIDFSRGPQSNDQNNPALTGAYFTLYPTGFGHTISPVQTQVYQPGAPCTNPNPNQTGCAPLGDLHATVRPSVYIIPDWTDAAPIEVKPLQGVAEFAGRATGLVSMDQFNGAIPRDLTGLFGSDSVRPFRLAMCRVGALQTDSCWSPKNQLKIYVKQLPLPK
ncbi:MAG TPA: hypothetical protein VEA59_01885 [Patescibacteria group bacterium]|nr:hypothetical protein [Patescibacteria group bacterium]